jgi:pimeloyl-ACP methyl ester carboxylesterase
LLFVIVGANSVLFPWITVTVILTLLLADFVYRRIVSGRISHLIENVHLFGVVQAGEFSGGRALQIPVADGQELAACLYSRDQPCHGIIIFCPELNGNRLGAMHYCAALCEYGYSVLAFDFRNQGDSDFNPEYKPTPWVTNSETEDVSAVVDYIIGDDSLKHLPIGIFGVSRGGCAAILAAAQRPEIRSVTTDSAYSTRVLINCFMLKFCRYIVPEWLFKRLPHWHNKIVVEQALHRSSARRGRVYRHLEDEVQNLTQPILLISGSRDSYVTPDTTHQLASLVSAEDNTWIVNKAKHNRCRSNAPAEYDERLVRHFRDTLLCESTDPIRKDRVA